MTKQEQCYVGGPMRGIRRFNVYQFDSLAMWLRHSRKWVVHNPADHDRETWPDFETWEGFEAGDTDRCPKFDLSTALSWDLARVAESQHLVLLPGWEASTGARHERHVAELTGSSIWLARRFPSTGWVLRLDMHRGKDSHPVYGSMQPSPVPLHEQYRTFDDLANKSSDGGSYDTMPYKITRAEFTTKDSGERAQFDSGMVRDTDAGKPRYDLIPLLPLKRLAELYARGAQKYAERNWEQANSQAELDRFKASAFRHLAQALNGERDEDHWSAVVFNVFACEWLEAKLNSVLAPGYAKTMYDDLNQRIMDNLSGRETD